MLYSQHILDFLQNQFAASLLDQHQAPVYCSRLLQSACRFLWCMDNQASNQWCSPLLDPRNFFNAFTCFYFTFYWLIKIFLPINHDVVVYYFYLWKKYLVCPVCCLLACLSVGSLKACINQVFQYCFCVWVDTFDWYLFHFIVPLNLDFNWSSTFVLNQQSYYWDVNFCIIYFKYSCDWWIVNDAFHWPG